MAQVLTLKRSCQPTGIIQSFLSLIPENIAPEIKQCNSDFTRNRKLPFPELITPILSFTTSGKSKGVDIKSGEFFRNAQRSGISAARNKVPWTVFRDIQQRAVDLACRLWPRDPLIIWRGLVAGNGRRPGLSNCGLYDRLAPTERSLYFSPIYTTKTTFQKKK